MNKKVLVSFTTFLNKNWHETISDLEELGVSEFALFMTGIKSSEERWQIYHEIKAEIADAKIPFVHLRSEMTADEIDYLVQNFGTEYFNFHPLSEFKLDHDLSRYYYKILMENTGPAIKNGLTKETVGSFGGICLDLAHLETARLQNFPGYKITLEILNTIPVFANHVSAIVDKLTVYPGASYQPQYDRHEFTKLSQFDYLKNYPSKFFGKYIALELMNPIAEQLEAKKYIEGILETKLNKPPLTPP